MESPAEAFARALEVERQAALHADFDTLLRVQEEKRELLPKLKESADPELVDQLSERARKNVQLLRQLLATVSGMLGVGAESAYTASGQSSLTPATQTTVRGRL